MISDVGTAPDPRFKSRKRLIEFRLPAFGKARSVYLASSYSCWNTGAYPLKRQQNDWAISLPFYEGRYNYNFVIDGCRWISDPQNPIHSRNPLNQDCSVLEVKDPEPLPLYHDQTPLHLDIAPGKTVFRLRIRHGSTVEKPMLIIGNEPHKQPIPMEAFWANDIHTFCEASLDSDKIQSYYFQAFISGKACYLTSAGISDSPSSLHDFTIDTERANAFTVPVWAQGALFYQIMPDRFCRSGRVSSHPNLVSWGTPPTHSQLEHYGGDLWGIAQKIPYLQELGVNALYLTPIFCSHTNHKYTIRDYYQVDPWLGGNEALHTLLQTAHSAGIRVILDGVFRSSGDDFPPFLDVLKNQRKSPYANWYHIRKFPIKNREHRLLAFLLTRKGIPAKIKEWLRTRFPPRYEMFNMQNFHVYEVPRLNLHNPETRDYFLEVGEHWVANAKTDGWRLDVAHGIPHEFWTEFRRRIKSINPDAFLFGEVWGAGDQAEAREWVGPQAFDGIMNYWLWKAILEFFIYNTINAEAFANKLGELRANVPHQALLSMYNPLSTHDTPRILSLAKGDVLKVKLAALFLLTFPGAPAIFYGDEVGLQGDQSFSTNRGSMPWNSSNWNQSLANHYRALIAIRQAHPALQKGDFHMLQSDPIANSLLFLRTCDTDQILVAINNGDAPAQLPLPEAITGDWVDLFQQENFVLNAFGRSFFLIPPKNARILASSKSSR